MQIIKKQISEPCRYDFSKRYALEELLFFDIETTGLSADISSLYLIGCVYYEHGNWQLIQWFADEYHEEQELITAFFEFTGKFSYLLHYNGNGFDIPYLKKKCAQYDLPYTFENIQSIDLYKKFSPFKKILNLSSIKQKKVEELFGLYRKDKYSGGELIKVYGEYMHGKMLKKDINLLEEMKETLLLHNHEDLTGLLYVTPVLAFHDLLEQPPQILGCYPGEVLQGNDLPDSSMPDELVVRKGFLLIDFIPPSPLPIDFTVEKEGFYLQCENTKGSLTISTINNQFRLYFKNYKDYYYLPTEDMAVHKSIAVSVDKEYRQKATKENCYTKVTITEALVSDTTQLAQVFQNLLSYYFELK